MLARSLTSRDERRLPHFIARIIPFPAINRNGRRNHSAEELISWGDCAVHDVFVVSRVSVCPRVAGVRGIVGVRVWQREGGRGRSVHSPLRGVAKISSSSSFSSSSSKNANTSPTSD